MITKLYFQIGKNGVTAGVIESLKLAFKNHKQVRISVLKSSGRTSDTMHQIAEEVKEKLGGTYQYKVVGFTIILNRRMSKLTK